MRKKYRELAIESIERRIVLSANAGGVDTNIDASVADQTDQPTVGSTSISMAHISDLAYIATDNSLATARNLGVLDGPRSFQDEYVGRFDSRDIFRFELPTAGSVSIDLKGLSTDADLYLLDTNGVSIATSENWGNAIEAVRVDLDAGEYFVVVNNYNRFTSTLYSLDLTATHFLGPDVAGDTFDTALNIGELASDQIFADYVGTSDSADVFRFELGSASGIQLDLTSLVDDVDLYLYSATQVLIGESNAEETSDEQINAALSPGSYFVAVLPYATANSEYTLTLANLGPAEVEPNPDPPISEPPSSEPPDESAPPESPSSPPQDSPSDSPVGDGTLAAVPYFGGNHEWGLNIINAPEAWNAGYAGQGVTVAVIDTGFQLDHIDLQQAYWINVDETFGDGIDNDGNGFVDDRFGWDFVGDDADPTSATSTHATHVTGIIAADHNTFGATGVAYATQIMPIRVLDDEGSGTTYDVAQGIRYAVDNGADIINLSLGGDNSATIHSALRYAEANDVLVVAASGNENAAVPSYPARHSARLSNVLSVGAYDSNQRLASFSNRVGGSLAVQIDAPGVSIYNTLVDDRYGYLSGTSMATPYTAGVAALTLSANPQLTSTQLREVLTQGAGVTVSDSDSIGGVDAAATIALARTYSGSVDSLRTVGSTNEVPSSLSQRVYAAGNDLALASPDANTLALIAVERDWSPTSEAFEDEDFAAILESIGTLIAPRT